MAMDWDSLFLKYIWNKNTTPYFTAVDNLNLRQAHSEVLIFAFFLGAFFSIVTVLTTLGTDSDNQAGVALYGFTVVCASIIIVAFKSYWAALYLSATPVVCILYIFFFGMAGDRPRFDTLLVLFLLILFALYSVRILKIVQQYPSFPEPPPPPNPWE